ncbi:endonuclease/exonuclease/phosphatase family protein [Sunxiuqinia sp. sy24]|uniref:endonuclease/exonuclease/phosphatase family protein n=1 Tax=Sunxiuqinia sp. sy24 TaxID=3461495 RepID=UPI004045FD7B
MVRFLACFLIFLFINVELFGQSQSTDVIHILYYNVENLFDTANDPLTDDDEFLPEGGRRWNDYRFYQKLKQLSKVILASAGFEPPEIIGLCEVENRDVLEKLLDATPLKKYNYSIIHKDSPDERGIDVALLYRSGRVTPIGYQYLPIRDIKQRVMSTREILSASFQLTGMDTIQVFINHWPSRYGGQAETEAERMQAAKTLRQAIDAIQEEYLQPKMVVMGDFNDQPQNRSLTNGLKTVSQDDLTIDGELISLSSGWKQGTIKYRQTWTVFDQILVSDQLLKVQGWHTRPEFARPVALPFLLEADPKFKGQKLNRTYVGFKYHGGFSDHLPVLLKLEQAN